MAVLSPWSPPWRSVSALPSAAATDAEVASAIEQVVVYTGSGAPTTGTHDVGTLAIDEDGNVYANILAGTPGTWQILNSGRLLDRGEYLDSASLTVVGNTVADMHASLSITFTSVRPVMVFGYLAVVSNGSALATCNLWIADESNVAKARSNHTSATANAGGSLDAREYIPDPGTYTRKLRFSATVATTMTVAGKGASTQDFINFIQAVEV